MTSTSTTPHSTDMYLETNKQTKNPHFKKGLVSGLKDSLFQTKMAGVGAE